MDSQRKVDYVKSRTVRLFTDPTFYYPKRHREILSSMPDMEGYEKAKAEVHRQRKREANMNPMMRLCYEEPLLTREQEWHLFRIYNFRKFQALKNLHAGRAGKACDFLQLADEVRNQLLLCNTRLAANFAKRKAPHNFEDVFADAYELVLKAIDYFDYNRKNQSGGKNKFSTYATWVIQNQHLRNCGQEAKRESRLIRGVILDDFHSQSLGYDEEVRQLDREELVRDILEFPDQREADILRMRFGISQGDEVVEPMTLEKVGENVGVTKERIRQLEKRALNKIRGKVKTSA